MGDKMSETGPWPQNYCKKVDKYITVFIIGDNVPCRFLAGKANAFFFFFFFV